MKNIWLGLLLFLLILSCNNKTKSANINDFTPSGASTILRINSLESLRSQINNNDFLQSLSPTASYQETAKLLDVLQHLNSKSPVVVSMLKDEQDRLQFVFATKQTADALKLDSIQGLSISPLTLQKNTSGQALSYNNQKLFTIIHDSILVGSSNKDLLDAVLKPENANEDLKKMLATSSTESTLAVIMDSRVYNPIQSLFYTDDLNTAKFTNLSSFDTDIRPDRILLNGVTKAVDSSLSLINVFKQTQPQENEIASITPGNSDGFLSLSFDSYDTFQANLDLYQGREKPRETEALFSNIIELGSIYEGENSAIVLHSIDVISTKDALIGEQNKVETYRQVELFKFSKPELFADYFAPFIAMRDAQYYCNIDQFFVFANTVEQLENIIANTQNKTTLDTRDHYEALNDELSAASSLLQVVNPSALKKVLDKNLAFDYDTSFSSYRSSALQFIYDQDYAHFNMILKKNKAKAVEHSVTEGFQIKLDAALQTDPQFVTNHINQTQEIVVQDINNKLYLISNSGNVLWTKVLNGPILGKVSQIDVYKNGKLQLAFATPHRVYVIARNGKDVDGYPLEFQDEISQPLSVFDYDKTKKYRLFVTQDSSVLLFDSQGKTVPGFQFKKANNTINSQPQHLRIGTKDYVLIKTADKLNILTRRGEPRVVVKTKLNYSEQAVYNYKNKFSTTTADGKLVHIDQKGSVRLSPLSSSEQHNLTATLNTLVTQLNHKLSIKGKSLELDYGNYTRPKIFYIKDKIYISVTELQSQKVLLFDSQGKSIANFPVYGNSAIDLKNIDKDPNLEFVTKGESNSILVYKIN